MPRTIIGILVILLATFSTSYSMSKYQTDITNKSNEYIKLIKEIPDNIGNWERISSKPLLPFETEELKVRDAEYWTYKNKKNGAWVVISIFVGPTGRVGVHTPEICLAGTGYRVKENRILENFKILDEHSQIGEISEDKNHSDKSSDNADSQQFWRVVVSDEASPDRQRVFYYALGTGKNWWAVNNPRFELSSYPFIMKIQAETEMEIADVNYYNSVREFLDDFLPVVKDIFENTNLEETYGKKR
ncbi:MAG: exosortase-associated EpsI family protein [Planctomycetaceae bacterium]|jgi:hypothetical protein|nr:exosortase-associated EpsI family protein [Planctomycetaceae bacterium]